jgi:hypothetical protein
MCKDAKFEAFDMSRFSFEDVADWYRQLTRGVENKVFLPNPKDCFVCTVAPYCRYGTEKPLQWNPTREEI